MESQGSPTNPTNPSLTGDKARTCLLLQVTMEDAEQLMRDAVFDEWRKSDCESYADTLKLVSLIDVFLPYLPLGRQHMPDLVELALKQRQANLRHNQIQLQWEPSVVQLVANKVSAAYWGASMTGPCVWLMASLVNAERQLHSSGLQLNYRQHTIKVLDARIQHASAPSPVGT
jgi:hypothetical protein